MLNETFRYAVSNWVISTKENRLPHLITQEEMEFLLEKTIIAIENNNTDIYIDWIIQKNKKDSPEKISKETIDNLKSVAMHEMIMLIKKETKIKIPKGFTKDILYFSKKHNEGF